MYAAVGKSGPGMAFIRVSMETSGSSISSTRPSTISDRLWGGMLVAIPTAMPEEPLTSRFGTFVGRTVGSCSDSSKFGEWSTVSFSMSARSSWAIFASRVSV